MRLLLLPSTIWTTQRGNFKAGRLHCAVCSVHLFLSQCCHVDIAYLLEHMLLEMYEVDCNKSVWKLTHSQHAFPTKLLTCGTVLADVYHQEVIIS